ncbi:MAG: CD225/dispanin family protein [Candidatus Firestonebacteria bacterium]
MIKCKSCGKENDDNLWKCEACNFSLQDEPGPQVAKLKPKNYTVISILLILFCVPTAVVSFIYGMKVNSSFLSGKYEEAETYAKKAKLWVWLSVGIGVILMIIFMMHVASIYKEMSPLMDKEMQKILGE